MDYKQFNTVPEWCPYSLTEIKKEFAFDLQTAIGNVTYKCVRCKKSKKAHINSIRMFIRRGEFTSLCSSCRGTIQRTKKETFKLKKIPSWLKKIDLEFIEHRLNDGKIKDIKIGNIVNRGLETLCSNCDTPIHSSISKIKQSINNGTYTGLCIKCLSSVRNEVDARNPKITDNGYVLIQKSLVPETHHWLCNWNAPVMIHRYKMAIELNRPLTKDEIVHHIDGNKQNNSIENLELWSKSHPSGQRVIDKLKWAKEFVNQYEKEMK